MTRRHCGGYLTAGIYICTRCFKNGVPAQTTYLLDTNVLRDSYITIYLGFT